MNIKELKLKMQSKLDEAKSASDLEAKKGFMAEYDDMKVELSMLEKIEAEEKSFVAAAPAAHVNKEPELSDYEKAEKSFADAARNGFAKSLNEGTAKDGGYTVPQEISTKIEHLRDAKFSLRELVDVKVVSTLHGERTFMKRAAKQGFGSVAEGGKIQAVAQPEFGRAEWNIEKYAGYMPVTNELLADSDANIVGEVTDWFADQARVTDNKLILATMDEKYTRLQDPETAKPISSLDDIKKILNVDLGQAFKATSVVVTNDNGLQWLDTLKDGDGNYILSEDPASPMQYKLAAGATVVPLRVVPNVDLADDPSAGIPFYIGDLKEAIKLFDRKQLSIMSSNIAAIGTINAFEEDLTIWRGILREDCICWDDKAYFKGFKAPAAG